MNRKNIIILGLALFAMFFGAGNLIFPPSIGNDAGADWLYAMIGFFITGIGMPILGILAIVKAGGLIKDFGKNVGSNFSVGFGLIVVLILGPFMGVPRTGATTFEMGISPLFPSVPMWLVIGLFFLLTWILSVKQSSIIDIIGKWLTPVLVVLLVFIVIMGIAMPIGTPSTVSYTAFKDGFTGGYQTMDLFVSIMLGAIILKALRDKGYKTQKEFFGITWKAGVIAAVGLATIYGGLLYIGATGQDLLVGVTSRPMMTVTLVNAILGNIGSLILGVCVSFACLTTSIGITAAASEFINEITPKNIKYKWIVTVNVIISAIMAMGGVDFIVSIAGPLLTIIYPLGIVLVFMNILDDFIKYKACYMWTVLVTSLISIPMGISELGILNPSWFNFINELPLSSYGLPWLIPAILGFLVSHYYYDTRNRFKRKPVQQY